MIHCHQCKREVSKEFTKCPYCGHKLEEPATSQAVPIAVGILAGLLVLLVLVWGLGFISVEWLVDHSTFLFIDLFIAFLVVGYPGGTAEKSCTPT